MMRLIVKTVLLVLAVWALCSCKISGSITDENGSPVAGVTVRLTGDMQLSTTTDSAGRYQFSDREITDGTFIVTPVLAEYEFLPPRLIVRMHNTNVDGIDFTAVATSECRSDADCGDDAWCRKAMGDCDGIGQCVERQGEPVPCPSVYDPVCGCDGKTYGNACEIRNAGINIKGEGECPSGPITELTSPYERDTAPAVSDDDRQALAAGNIDFALALYHQLSADGSRNLIYSPYSISTALAMLYAGAAGNTETQMAECLRFALPQETLHSAFNYLDLALDSRGEGAAGADGGEFRLNVSNAIWLQEDFPVLSDYLDLLAINYGAGVYLLDFMYNPEPSRVIINDWVAQQTEDRIIDLLPFGSVSPYTLMVLTNTVYFNAAWRHPFAESLTENEPFNLLDSSTVEVPMMCKTEKLGYYKGDNFQAVEMPYDGTQFAMLSMVAIVPDAGQFNAVGEAVERDFINTITDDMKTTLVNLTMPQWEYRFNLGLGEILQTMGMADAFGPGADFSGIDGRSELAVQDVIHEAFIKVNEAGTEAAAATAIIGVGSSSEPPPPPKIVRLDRPFIYFIRDIQTKTILFVGNLVDPSQK